MKKLLSFTVFLSLLIALFSCKREHYRQELPHDSKKTSFVISELGLTFSVSYEERNPDNLKASLSGGFELIKFHSLYNEEQKREYFILKIRRNDSPDLEYLIHGICNVDGSSQVSFSELTN